METKLYDKAEEKNYNSHISVDTIDMETKETLNLDHKSVHQLQNQLSIAEFYVGKNVFITGGSGFIGKVIIEKLLRSCPKLNSIYMMIRPKKGKLGEERIKEMFKLPLFEKLVTEQPDITSKVIAVAGDICSLSLGINKQMYQELQENVHIVLHSAATVRFDEPLRVAMEMNVFAVQEMIKLCRGMNKLEVFCHVSTAYSQCNLSSHQAIDEMFYTMEQDPGKVIEILSWMSDEMLSKIEKDILKGYPNTYCFTKAIAELLLKEQSKDLPLIIIRPSIVCASISDPVAGWIDNYNGVSGMVAAAGRGVLRTMKVDPEVFNDIVPVDLVSKCCIVSIWYYGTQRPNNDPMICNCTSSHVNPTRFSILGTSVVNTFEKYPYNSIVRRPNFAFAGNGLLYGYWVVVSHYLPAVIADGLALLTGNTPKYVNVYKNLHRSLNVFDFFMFNEWKWTNSTYNQILKGMPDHEREVFSFDMRQIDWHKYYQSLALGVKLYLVKEKMDDLPKAFRLKQRYKMVRWLSTTILTLLACRFFYLRSTRFRRVWFNILFTCYQFLGYLKLVNS